VIFTGQIANGRRYFRAFDVFALTSDNEPFGMVLLEAMAAGLPIISSDSGGAREVVNTKSQLFPLGDSLALAKRLIYLQQNTEATQVLTILQLERLRSLFADDSARIAFKNLLFVSQYISETSRVK
jgi:glycosyltransferase involved in cell wall biosynthesis